MQITATVPPIGASTWTVTVCDNGVCDSSTLTADMAAGVASVELLREGDAWKLVVTRVVQTPSNGDVWSLHVVDDGGQTIAKGEHAVTYSRQTTADGCTTCRRASFSLD